MIGRRAERGQIFVLTALVCMWVLVPFLFFLADFATKAIVSESAQQAVFTGARGGASIISVSDLQSSSDQIDPYNGTQTCDKIVYNNITGNQLPGKSTVWNPDGSQATGAASFDGCQAVMVKHKNGTVTSNQITATVTVKVNLMFPTWMNNQIGSTYTATIECGVTTRVRTPLCEPGSVRVTTDCRPWRRPLVVGS